MKSIAKPTTHPKAKLPQTQPFSPLVMATLLLMPVNASLLQGRSERWRG